MDRYQLARQLHQVLIDLEKAEEKYHEYIVRFDEIQHQLLVKESELLTQPLVIDGKNKEVRGAQLFQHTVTIHKEKYKIKERMNASKLRVESLQRKYETSRLVVQLLLTPGFDMTMLDESVF